MRISPVLLAVRAICDGLWQGTSAVGLIDVNPEFRSTGPWCVPRRCVAARCQRQTSWRTRCPWLQCHCIGICRPCDGRDDLPRGQREHDRMFSLLIPELDNCKACNDDFRRFAGDKGLRITGQLFGAALRSPGLAARPGGEEFALLLRAAEVAGPAEWRRASSLHFAALRGRSAWSRSASAWRSPPAATTPRIPAGAPPPRVPLAIPRGVCAVRVAPCGAAQPTLRPT